MVPSNLPIPESRGHSADARNSSEEDEMEGDVGRDSAGDDEDTGVEDTEDWTPSPSRRREKTAPIVPEFEDQEALDAHISRIQAQFNKKEISGKKAGKRKLEKGKLEIKGGKAKVEAGTMKVETGTMEARGDAMIKVEGGAPPTTKASSIQQKALKRTKGLAHTNYKLVEVGEEDKTSEEVPGPSNAVVKTPTAAEAFARSGVVDKYYPPFQLRYCEKPIGTVGKAPPKGYNIEHVAGMIHGEYLVMLTLTEVTLMETPGIKMRETIMHQKSRSLVETVKLKLAARRPEFKIFEDDGYWILEAFILLALKYIC
ncbi:hypothetical protein RSOL_353670, partial [Rhizoctonia solani AG-3 Rhs1AP]